MPLVMPHAVSAATDAAGDRAYFEVTWHDTETDAHGYLVIDRLVRGLCSGGLRMRAGCSLTEVRGLARGMTLKEAIHYEPGAGYVPLGGAKGGIDFDPYHPEADAVLLRYLAAMRPLIEQRWTMGEDFGVRQQTVDRAIAQLGMDSPVQAAYQVVDDVDAALGRMRTAFAETVDGIALDEVVGGYGVAEAALATLRHNGMRPETSTAFVQGFGSMGGATARYLAAAGLRVVGIADVHGVVANPGGLDVEQLLRIRDSSGAVDRTRLRTVDTTLPGERWLTVAADVLVPAAMSYCIDADNQHLVTASVIVEAANMPVTPRAESALLARGVTIAPDFVANSATNAWWWWVLFGDIDGSAAQSFAKIAGRIGALSAQMFDHADRNRISPRAAAFAIAAERLDTLATRFAPTVRATVALGGEVVVRHETIGHADGVELTWLDEPTVGALRRALRTVAPDLAESTIVPRGLEPNDDPRWCAASAVVDGRFVVKFAWARPPALRICHQAQVLGALRTAAPRLPLPEVVTFASDPAMLVLRWVPATPFFEVRHRIGPAERDTVARELATVLAELHDPGVLRAVAHAVGPLPEPTAHATTDTLRARFGALVRPDQRDLVLSWCDWADTALAAAGRTVLVHGDFHGDNHLWDRETLRLRLVVDLETVGTGEPEFDLRCLPADCGIELFTATVAHYEKLTGTTLDVDRIMAWHLRSVLGDALWRAEAGIPLPDKRTPVQWVDDLTARFVALRTFD